MDGYIRVSRVGGRTGDSFISPKVQRRQMEAWCEALGHTLAAVHEDLDQPGTRIDRPGLQAAISRIEAGEVAGLVCARLDRFGRSVQDSANLLARIRDADGALFTVSEGINTEGYMGKFLADIFAALGELELNRIRENWNVARTAAVARGIHVAGRTPIGYRKQDDGRLAVDPDVASVVAELFSRRAGGDSWATLADWLVAQEVATASGSHGWTVNSVKNIVQNRVYLGEARGGRGLVHPDAHPALVTQTEFDAASRVRGVARPRSGTASGLLSGILRCAGCRYAMKLSQGKTRHGKPFVEYRCKSSRRETATTCSAPTAVKADVVEPFVIEHFFAFVGNYEASDFEPDAEVDKATERLHEAEGELAAALDTRLADALEGSSEVYLQAIRDRQDAVDSARADLSAAQRRSGNAALRPVELSGLWPNLDLYERRKLLSSVFECVFVRRTPGGGGPQPVGGRTWICWHGEAPRLPTRGQRWSAEPFEFPGRVAEPVA